MADTKNRQTGSAGLPEKEWFTLEEIAKRWGCTVHDLLHYGTNKKLTLCFRPGCRPIHYILSPCTILDDGWPEEAIDGKDVFIDNSEKWNGINRFLSNWSLVCIPEPHLFHISKYGEWKGEIKRIDCIFDHSFKPEFNNLILRRREAFHVPESGHAYTVRARFGSNKDSPAPELSISLPDILVPKEERDRFEQEHRIGAYAGTMPSMTEETEVRRLQRTLGALVLGLARDASKWRNGNKPNVSAIVSTSLNGVSDESGNAPHGFSDTTFTNTINAALKACQSELNR